MPPEAEARKKIDRQLAQAGWVVQDYKERNITAALGVAIREFPTKNGPADYLLYVDCRAIGVVEAKPEGHTLTGVEIQSDKYTTGLPKDLPRWTHDAFKQFNRKPCLPFAYESTGVETQFTSHLDPEPRSREIFTFHRPEELQRLAELDTQLRASLRDMPELNTERLWPIQIRAVSNLETSLSENRPRALIQMATGSGKTFTAATFCYRLIKYANAKRILFLVDRDNLRKQTFNEFEQYISPYNGKKFTDEFNVQRLKSGGIASSSRICISTVQRLYSMLQGEEEFDEENEQQSQYENDSPLVKEPLPVVYSPTIPIETFDFIVIDECHRSIYNLWRQVLEYFDAYLIGLSATPTNHTIGFFQGNLVEEYTHEDAVADGVNVGFDVFRIRTKITEQGAKLVAKPDIYVPHRDRRTRKKRFAALTEDKTYTANDLDRDVVADKQIRLVIQTFRDHLFTDIFPGRKEVPKTLVFAKDDSHADDITKIIRQVFGKGNEFCQKITYKTTGKKPEDLLSDFRNSYNPRIAVSVDMIATGTDVKPLECLLFMRNIKSAGYFDQMKGRGVRIIDSDTLQTVTPDTKHKTRFVIVDAVGVCEQDKTNTKPIDRKPSVSLEKILGMVASGVVHADVVSTLAARLARMELELDDEQEEQIKKVADGKALKQLTRNLLDSLDPDRNHQKAVEKFDIPDDQEPTDEQLDQVEQESMRESLKPFHNPNLRDTILGIKKINEQVIDEQTPDQLLGAGYDKEALEKAQSLVGGFRQFIEDNKGEIEALQVLYSRPYRAGLNFRDIKELAAAIQQPPLSVQPIQLWQAFETIAADKVKGRWEDHLVDLIALVRHAINPDQPLVPVHATVEERYQAWLADQEAAGAEFTPEQRKWLDAIKDHIANSLSIDADAFDYAPFNNYGGLGRAHELFGDRLTDILNELNARLAA